MSRRTIAEFPREYNNLSRSRMADARKTVKSKFNYFYDDSCQADEDLTKISDTQLSDQVSLIFTHFVAILGGTYECC